MLVMCQTKLGPKFGLSKLASPNFGIITMMGRNLGFLNRPRFGRRDWLMSWAFRPSCEMLLVCRIHFFHWYRFFLPNFDALSNACRNFRLISQGSVQVLQEPVKFVVFHRRFERARSLSFREYRGELHVIPLGISLCKNKSSWGPFLPIRVYLIVWSGVIATPR